MVQESIGFDCKYKLLSPYKNELDAFSDKNNIIRNK